MKTPFVILIFLASYLGFSQSEKSYILLSDITFKNKNVYTLDTQKMYGIKGEIELYNLEGYNNEFLLFSVLPDLETHENWQEVPYVLIEKNIVSAYKIRELIWAEKELKIFNKYRLVKKVENKFFVAKNVLIEKFQVLDYDTSIKISGSNVINTKEPIRTHQDIKKAYTTQINPTFPMEDQVSIRKELKALYLFDIQEKNDQKIYLFWTFSDWENRQISVVGGNYHYTQEVKTPQDYAYHRGIDRFAYIEGKGIVGGSYDFYFDQHPKDFKRMIRKDIMWAKKLFPERQ